MIKQGAAFYQKNNKFLSKNDDFLKRLMNQRSQLGA